MTPILEARGLTRRFGRRVVLDNVSVEVKAGEVVGLLGPNGAGKTTCFDILAGILRPNDGQVWLKGQEVTHLPLHRRARAGLGYLPQDPSIFRGMTVEANLLTVLEARGLNRLEQEKRTGHWLEELELFDLRRQRADRLSGGERRRLEIARALSLEPTVLLLDEPFSGVDPRGVGELKQWLRRFARQGIGVLLTDHNAQACFHICDRTTLLFDGRVFAEGSPSELVDDPAVRLHYLGSDFRLG